MWVVLLALGCAPAPTAPPALALPAPFTELGPAAAGAAIGKSTPTKLVLHYPKDADPTATAERFLAALRERGYTVEGPQPVGPSLLWTTRKDGAELLVSAVPKQSRLEIHLDE